MRSTAPRQVVVSLVGLALVLTSFAALPPRAHALFGVGDTTVVIGDVSPTNIGSWLENTVTAVSTLQTQIKGYVLDPLAHMLAQAVLKSITASVVDSINGRNGSPSFVKNLSLTLQMVGDRVGLSFITQFNSSIRSPFTASIANALHTNYLQSTSLAGFFAGNQCTLSTISGSNANINSFLAGSFNKGGLSTWFALTTQDKNNPLAMFLNAKSQLASAVTGAQGKQSQVVTQNNGFLSWCSSGRMDDQQAGLGAACSDFANGSDCNGNFVCVQSAGKTTGTCQQPTAATSDDTASTCYNKDGTPGSVETPGSVIHDQLTKTLGSGVDSLVSVHDFNQMVDTILAALATKVVSTGLSALSGSGGSGSVTRQITTSTDPNAAAVGSQALTTAQGIVTRVEKYSTAWTAVQTAAQAASSDLQNLSNTCAQQSSPAQTALQTEVQPVLSQAQAALNSAATTKTLALRVESEASATSAGSAGALTADLQTLIAAPPTASDLATAQSNASETGAATSSPGTPLSVSGGTLVDQMKLISKNAQTLRSCILVPLL